ncbi:MAG: hypothetical protein LAT64_01930 [Phycisphaerales bacterium]|nr:ComF family protein [Planctomycetota bacterium]MCH8507519.1 hypothetical protein [Phycisphaerales bacterium]
MSGPGRDGAVGSDAFVWPPSSRIHEPIRTDAPEEEASTLPPGRPAGITGRAEADLIGVRSISFARWVRATGWQPDRFGAFCWRCAGSVGPHEVDGNGCGSCREKTLAWDRAARLGLYHGGVRAAVTELKFGRWRRTGAELGAAMGDRLGDLMAAGGFTPDEVVLMPVPASWRRRMGRGIDHTTVLARAAGKRAGVRVIRGLARRHTPTQVGLSATARAANIRGAFRARPCLARLMAGEHPPRVVVVLDDVRTTGATMTVACRAVRKIVGIKTEIWALTAVVASDRRGQRAGDSDPARAEAARVAVWSGLGRPGHEKFEKTFGVAV